MLNILEGGGTRIYSSGEILSYLNQKEEDEEERKAEVGRVEEEMKQIEFDSKTIAVLPFSFFLLVKSGINK